MKITTLKNYSRIANYIEKNKIIQKTLYYADKNPSIFQSVSVFALASILRPGTILALPSKTEDGRKDSLYSASKSIITGVVDLSTAFLIFMPLNKFIDRAGRKLYNSANTIYHLNKEGCSAFKSLFNRGAKILILPLIAYINFSYIKQLSNKITKLIFNGGKRDSKNSTIS